MWWKLHPCRSGTIWQYFWQDFWFYFLSFWTVPHGWTFYSSVSLVSFWFQFTNRRTCPKSIPISLKPSSEFAWWNTLHSRLILKSTIICSKFVLVKMFIVVLDNTNTNIYIWLTRLRSISRLVYSARFRRNTLITPTRTFTIPCTAQNSGARNGSVNFEKYTSQFNRQLTNLKNLPV